MLSGHELFKNVFESECQWLRYFLKEMDAGRMKITREDGASPVDITSQIATDYRHRLGNFEIMLAASDRLGAPGN